MGAATPGAFAVAGVGTTVCGGAPFATADVGVVIPGGACAVLGVGTTSWGGVIPGDAATSVSSGGVIPGDAVATAGVGTTSFGVVKVPATGVGITSCGVVNPGATAGVETSAVDPDAAASCGAADPDVTSGTLGAEAVGDGEVDCWAGVGGALLSAVTLLAGDGWAMLRSSVLFLLRVFQKACIPSGVIGFISISGYSVESPS